MDTRNDIALAISAATGMDAAELLSYIEIPPDSSMGDYAFPCFRLAKAMRKAPAAIAAELKDKLALPACITRAEVAGGYLNFFEDRAGAAAATIMRVLNEGENYGHSSEGQGKNVCVEFSSINIAKPFHIGHLPSTAIGNSLNRIYKALGYNTIAINHLGDWGTQFGKMIVAYKKWGGGKPIEESTVRELVKLYVRFHEEAEKDESLNDEARAWFRKIEQGDAEAVDLWQRMKTLTLKEVGEVYKLLGVEFDSYNGESFYEDKMQAVIDELDAKGLLKTDKGAKIVDLSEYNMPPCIIVKSDGATLYATRDLAAAIYRKNTYDFVKSIYVVAYQQNLHFQQLKKILELMGFEWAKDIIHVPFGLVSLEEGTMSTREGRVVFLEDVLNRAIDETRDIIKEKGVATDNIEETAKQVGIGAVVFNELSNNRIKDYVFSWKKVLDFNGETGPYVQYTYARAASILRNAGEELTAKAASGKVDPKYITSPSAYELAKLIYKFPQVVVEAGEKYEPSIVTRHIVDLAQSFNRFYHDEHILVDNEEEKVAKLALVIAAKTAIKNGLALLGMQAPERM